MKTINGKIYIFSAGGCGTRIFYDWVKKYYNRINNQSRVHHDIPPKKLGVNDRVIYLFGTPEDSILSFYKKDADAGKFIKEHCQNLKIPFVNLNIDDYIEKGDDLFGLRFHFNKYNSLNNIMLVNYNYLWENLDVICDYLNLSEVKSTFPTKKERRDIKIQHDKKGLSAIYVDFNKIIDKIKIIKK